MERNSLHSQGYKLESQIREAYGKVTYTQTCHDKIISSLLKTNNRLKVWQIVLSAVTTSGFVVAILSEGKIASILGAIVSLLLLVLNSYVKNFDLIEDAQQHKEASDLLWKIREEYVSLLTDFEILSVEEIMNKRNELQERTAEVYSGSPRTTSKSYKEAQKALKTEEEQTFSEHEIDVMLPNSIRRCNRDIDK
ncbi:SLATT domain-containing protein [Candidatus Stoquefichus massiliensis]|uniref:SLATT domain-containing protein n=1 Tax=Candidatus Stoquefichus massiliensis TaxID=1470350 RepID=UPI0004802B07|nr:SLATT domain-containing protein [Candidatus Stoquefichus massiliensis]